MIIKIGSLFPSTANKLTLDDRLNKYLPKDMIDSSRDYCMKVLECSNFKNIKGILNKVDLSFYLEYQNWFLSQLEVSNMNYDQRIVNSYEFYSKIRTIPAKVLSPYLPDMGRIESLAQQQDINDLKYVTDFLAFNLSQDSNLFLDIAYQYFEEFVSQFGEFDYIREIIDVERDKLNLSLKCYFLDYVKKFHRKQCFLTEVDAENHYCETVIKNKTFKDRYCCHRVGHSIEPVRRR